MAECVSPEMFRGGTATSSTANPAWNADRPWATASCYAWDPASTYIQEPPFLTDLAAAARADPADPGARVLLALGDSVTTDHISPAGSIAASSPAGKYLHRARRRAGRLSIATVHGAATIG